MSIDEVMKFGIAFANTGPLTKPEADGAALNAPNDDMVQGIGSIEP